MRRGARFIDLRPILPIDRLDLERQESPPAEATINPPCNNLLELQHGLMDRIRRDDVPKPTFHD